MASRDPDVEGIISELVDHGYTISVFGGGPVQMDDTSIWGRVINRLVQMLNWNLVEDASPRFEAFRRKNGEWHPVAEREPALLSEIPNGSILLVPKQ